jgi:AraC-like DNA-binding protein
MYTKETGVLNNSSIFFHTSSSIAKSLFFYLKCAGHFYCSEGYNVKRDNYDSYLLMFIKSGHGVVTYENKTYSVNSNDVVLLDCHKPHCYSTEDWESLWIHFEGNVIKDFFNLLYDSYGCVYSLGNKPKIYDYLQKILEDFHNNSTINEALISCYIQDMLTELLLLSSSINLEETASADNPIIIATSHIKHNFKNKITLEELSSRVNLSPFHFSRVFKKETGYSPYEYIQITRINEAKKLLKGSNLLIKEVAFATGFNSESSFVTSFKKHTKLTPKNFRNTPV